MQHQGQAGPAFGPAFAGNGARTIGGNERHCIYFVFYMSVIYLKYHSE